MPGSTEMITLVGGEKGGSGKSTLATNLAALLTRESSSVILVDTDRQGTAANWASVRRERSERDPISAITCVQAYGNVRDTLRDLASRYRHVIVDAGGRDSEELRSAMLAANLLCVPVRPSQADLWTVEHVDDLVKLASPFNPSLTARVVLSIAPTNPRISEASDAREMLAECEHLKMCETVIRDRKAYRDAMCEGLGVTEMDDAKAEAEINILSEEISICQVHAVAFSSV